MLVIILVVFLLISLGAVGILLVWWQHRKDMHMQYLEAYIKEVQRNTIIRNQVISLTSEVRKEKGRNKSVEVRTGQIMEKAVPFLKIFGHDPTNAHFCGNFIDYVVFNSDEIVFVEVKTGKSRLSKKQRNIKKLIEEGNVRFELVRVDYDN